MDDEALLGELRLAAARFDPPPAVLPDVLEGLLSWRDPDAELAALVADSRELSGSVRGAQQDVVLRFEAGPFAVTFEVNRSSGGQYRIMGQVEPDGQYEVQVVQGGEGAPDQQAVARSDQWGRFEAYPVATGPVSLRLTPETGPPVRTAWVVL